MTEKAYKGRGRPPGARNRLKHMTGLVSDEMLRAGIRESGGLVPVVYLMGIMGDESQKQEVRIAAATTLMPYYHKRKPVELDIDLSASQAVAQQLELVYGLESESLEYVESQAVTVSN